VSEKVNRKLPAGNTAVQRLTLCSDRERHNAQRYRQADGQTDGHREGLHILYNNAGLICTVPDEIATENAENHRRRQAHPANIRISYISRNWPLAYILRLIVWVYLQSFLVGFVKCTNDDK